MLRRAGRAAVFCCCAAWQSASGFAQGSNHQTNTVSPVELGGGLEVELSRVDFGPTALPTLHSVARATHDGLWVMIAGRTNGMHNVATLDPSGLSAFPPSSQNREVWVVDPATKQAWSRSLEDASSGLTQAQVDTMTASNSQSFQDGDRLYMVGGYTYDRTEEQFRTLDTLTALDLPGLVDWAKGGAGQAADSIRQTTDPALQVTGGALHEIDGRAHLVFGHNFDRAYSQYSTGVYTNQIRSFDIVDDGQTLSIANLTASPTNDAFRRRDLNVLPTISRGSGGALEQGMVALSGVFTIYDGAWTVPVEIDALGQPIMADPAAADTFKQGMNNYTSANVGLYSAAEGAMHMLLFGGISLNTIDRATGQVTQDDRLPYSNQMTDVVRTDEGDYKQHLLSTTFPLMTDPSGKELRFGANAEFFAAPGVAAYANGVLDLDAISEPTTIGYIFGGIVADKGNNGKTVASDLVFEVKLYPTPEPGAAALAGIAGLLGAYVARRARRASV
jgi:hypothetical protein